ncbi:TPA: phage N-6-adenine-methyltransferase [Klebsiella pneumoniae]
MSGQVIVVSFSGGRTSAYLVYLMEKRRAAGDKVFYLFMDTGAEHPETYAFIRNLVKHWGIPLVCLRVVINPELGKPNGYRVIDVSEIGPDLQPWKDICEKYGTPYFGGPLCTRAMKTEVFQRYCADTFGKGNYHTWLGIRADEPKRLIERKGVSYLAEISPFEKEDILDWWKEQPFDLGIPEHLGNCVFCIKKGLNKLALAARDEPVLAAEFWEMVTSPSVRNVKSRQHDSRIMYRERNTLESIIALYASHSREEIAATIRGGKGYASGSCTESCEAIVCDIDDEPLEQESKYCQKLSELKSRPSHKLKDVGDQWCTPDLLFWGINALFGPLVLDLFTDAQNSKCPTWYTAEDNALTQDWAARLKTLGGAAFGNPPYSRSQYHDGQPITGMRHIMNYAAEQRDMGGRYVFLVKATPSESWWPENADHISFIRGRVGFDLPQWFRPNDETQIPTSAFFAGAIVIFDKTWSGERFSYISRTELEERGRASLLLARYSLLGNTPPSPGVHSD